MSATRLLVVPVHTGSGMVSLRCGRLPSGERVAIAFTTQASLDRVRVLTVKRDGRARPLIRRETDEDMLRRDVG